ncbi:MAG TPA: hypothetical protein VHD33_00150 [Legionellaceae bacterium]|nr:hypothetical protein [Legionellaceae bacterium]
MEFQFGFNTEYNQFYIADKASPKDTDNINFWTTEAYDNRMAIGDGILGIGTECYGYVRGQLNVLNAQINLINYSLYDHVVEGGIKLKSSILQILNCPYSTLEVEVKLSPDSYRVRVYSSNLNKVKEGKDYYKIEIWPDSNISSKVLKKYTG